MRISDLRRGTYLSQAKTDNLQQAKLNGMAAADDDFINMLSGSQEEQSQPVKFVEEDSSKAEYYAGLRGFTAEYLYEYDQNYGNGDGVVTAEEHENALFQTNLASAVNNGYINQADNIGDEDVAAVQGLQRMAHLYTETMDFNGDGEISVEEASAVYAFSDKCEVEGVEDPQGTITSEAASVIDNYMIGGYSEQSEVFSKYLAGETLTEQEQEEYSTGVEELRNNTQAVGEDLGLDFSKQSSYFDVFNE